MRKLWNRILITRSPDFNCLLELNVVNKQTGVNDKGEVTVDSKTKNLKIMIEAECAKTVKS